MGSLCPETSHFEWISLPHDFASHSHETAPSHGPTAAAPPQSQTVASVQEGAESGFFCSWEPSQRAQQDPFGVFTADSSSPTSNKAMRVSRLQEPDNRVAGKHSYELNSSFPYEPGHQVSFKVVDVDARDEHGNECVQLMCCGERRCRNRLGEGVGKGLLIPRAQLRNKKQNFLSPHVNHHLPAKLGSAEREEQILKRTATRAREHERAWLWHGSLPTLPVVSTATEVEAWADKHLRSLELEDALQGMAIVIDAAAKVLPPTLVWCAGSSDDLPDERSEYAAVDGLFAFLEKQSGGGLKLQTPVSAQKPTLATLRTTLREGQHPALGMQTPLITELPAASKQDAQSRKLRSAMLSLLAGEDTMLPRTWLRDGRTVLNMLNDTSRKAALFLLVMHSHCNLETHVDALGTGCQDSFPPARRCALACRSCCSLHPHSQAGLPPPLLAAVMYHAHRGTKLVLVWPPTTENLERLGASLLSGSEHKPLDALNPFTGGGAHILRPGQRLVIAPMAIHLVVNLTPALSVGTNFNCPTSVALLKHLNSVGDGAPWYTKLLKEMVSIGLELKTASHMRTRLQAFSINRMDV